MSPGISTFVLTAAKGIGIPKTVLVK